MASVIEHAASSVLEEAVDEFYGQSKRKWALIVVAFILGGFATAVVAVKFRRHVAAETVGGPDADTTGAPPRSPASEARYLNSFETSPWSRRRAQIARTDALMRARVGRAASRLNIRRRAPVGRERNG